MIKLTISNSECQISGLSIVEHNQLRNLLSYQVPAYSRAGKKMGTRTEYLLNKKGLFPTGLLYLVDSFFANRESEYEIQDERIIPGKSLNLGRNYPHKPYPEQVEAAKACKKNSRGIICAPTGLGKSIIVALIISELQVPTLVIVPSLELKRQLTETLSGIFGKDKVGGLRGPITVENVQALDPNLKITGIDCVIIDEFHHSGAASYQKLNQKALAGVYYKFGLTATPFRSDDNERLLLEGVLAEVIYKIDYQTCVQKGYIVPMEAVYIELPKTPIKSNKWPEVYSKLITNNHYRNCVIAELLWDLGSGGVSTLCLVKEIKHGNLIKDIKGTTHFANGEDERCSKLIKSFSDGRLITLIGTTGVLGEGVDTKPAEFVIIAGLGKSKTAFMQACGRAFRKYLGKKSCTIILFKDDSHRWTKNHFKEQCKILLEEYSTVPIKLEV